MKQVAFFICTITCLVLKAQKSVSYDTLKNNGYFNFSINFNYTTIGKISNGGRGICLGAGFNIGRFFSKTIIIAPYIEIKPFSGFFQHNFTKEFVSDFNDNVNLTTQDSLGSTTLFKSLNNNNSYSHYGNVIFTYGINFSPYPKKYCGLGLSLKKGFISYRFTNASFLGENSPENAFITLPINYQIEATFKPFLKISKIDILKSHLLVKDLFSNVRIGIFFQELDWSKAKFENISFKSILPGSFIYKYRFDRQLGLTIKFIYE